MDLMIARPAPPLSSDGWLYWHNDRSNRFPASIREKTLSVVFGVRIDLNEQDPDY
jgi:hypothetical protein